MCRSNNTKMMKSMKMMTKSDSRSVLPKPLVLAFGTMLNFSWGAYLVTFDNILISVALILELWIIFIMSCWFVTVGC